MLLILSISRYLPISKRRFFDLFDALLFLYFFTLHADQLSLSIGEITFRLNNLIAFILLMIILMRFPSLLFTVNRWLGYALLFLAFAMLCSFFNSPYKKRCAFFLAWYGFTLLFYVVLPYFLIFKLDEQKIFKLYLASFICVGLYACLQLFFSLLGWVDPFVVQYIKEGIARPSALSYEPSFYALYMTPFVMMVNFHYLTQHDKSFFCFRYISIRHVLFVNGLFLISTSTSTFFAYGFFFFLFFFAFRKRFFSSSRFFRFFLSFSMLGALFGLLCPSMMKNFFMKFFFHGFLSHHSFFLRFLGIKNAWMIFLNHPFLGVGIGGIPPHLLDAWLEGKAGYILGSPVSKLLSQADIPNLLKVFEPTNVVTEILASLGVLGIIAFFFLSFVFYRQVKKSICVDPYIVLNLAFSTLIMLIVLQFNQGLFRTYVWVHFAMTFAFIEKLVIMQKKTT
ncbi:MAG: O-antigen ligase family protein [Chlamydiales bacterium]